MTNEEIKQMILQELQVKKDKFIEDIIKLSFDFKNDWDRQTNKIASLQEEERKEDKLNK